MYTVKEAECEDLPPSTSVVIPHIQRAQYHLIKYKNCIIPHPQELVVEDYGYQIVENKIFPILTPDVIMNVVKCACKSGCKNNKCSCKLNSVTCSDLCGCIIFDCCNAPGLIDADLSSDELDSEEE